MYRRTPYKKLILVILAVFVFSAFFSGEARSELAVGVERDVIHAQDATAATVRYDFRATGLGAGAWWWNGEKGHTAALAADYNAGAGPLDINLGAAYLTEADRINGTRLNFHLGAALNLGAHLRIQFDHFSNGQHYFKWEKDKPNTGWNFLGLAFRF